MGLDVFWVFVGIFSCLQLLHLLMKRSSLKTMFCANKCQASNNKMLPSPVQLPLIGHLYLLKGNPIVEMNDLSKKYGAIYKLQLGSVTSVVVSEMKLIRQILLQDGIKYGDRPNFLRYNILFGNDRENSLAFCDWSDVQKLRRSIARKFCHSRLYTDRLDSALDRGCHLLIRNIQNDIEELKEPHRKLKLSLQKACANIFFDFFCSEFYEDWENDKEFEGVVRNFDEIFWEINQGHPTDVLPIVSPFYKTHLTTLANMGVSIRQFVLQNIIEPRRSRLDKENQEDFVDILLTHLEDTVGKEVGLTIDQVLYELEDFIGGHSAVSNLLCRTLVEIGNVRGMSQKIYEQNFEKENKDYIKAVMYESLRMTSSPIVPHVASVDSKIDGYEIRKGTMILINNYHFNTSEEFWNEPQSFIPERFLGDNGRFQKPDHFFPFSLGRRSCMGYQLVEKVTQGIILAVIKDFNIEAMEHPTPLPVASVAISPKADLNLKLIPRIIITQ